MKKTVLEKLAKNHQIGVVEAVRIMLVAGEGVIWNTLAFMCVVMVIFTMLIQKSAWNWQIVLGLVGIATARTLHFLAMAKIGEKGQEFLAELRIYKAKFEKLFNINLPVVPVAEWRFEMLQARASERLVSQVEEFLSIPWSDFRAQTRASLKIQEMHETLSKGFEVGDQREFFDTAKYRQSRWRKLQLATTS